MITGCISAVQRVHVEAYHLVLSSSATVERVGNTASGWDIAMLGTYVELRPSAQIKAAGGAVAVGGGWGGKSELRRAVDTIVHSGASIDCDAVGLGDGGRIALWGDRMMSMEGAVSARGGWMGGNGGWIEVAATPHSHSC